MPHISLNYKYSSFCLSSYASAFFQLPKLPELPKLPKLPKIELPPPCGVSLPQNNKLFCSNFRKIPLAKNKLIYKLKRQDELNGFALLSANLVELRVIALTDPFMNDYTHHYLLQATEAIGSVLKYGLTNNLKGEIKDISEYLEVTKWFQDAMENKGLVNTGLFSLIYN